MPIDIEIPISQSIANGLATVFPHAFTVLDAGDLAVKVDTAGVITYPAEGSDYTVTGVGTSSGSVVFAVAPASGAIVTRYRDTQLKRETDYQENGDLLSGVLDNDFDRLWMALQEKVAGGTISPTALRVPVGETIVELPKAADRALRILAFDSLGAPLPIAGVDSGSAAALALDLLDTAPGKGADLVGGFIASSITLSVPSQYPTISDALTYLSGKTIARDAFATIQVADGAYSIPAGGIKVNHPQGGRIRIIGNIGNPGACIFSFPGLPTADAITVSNGSELGLLDGFTIRSGIKATQANNFTGVLAAYGGVIYCGQSVRVDNFYYGIAARVGSAVYAPGARVSNAGDVGIWAFVNSSVECPGAIVSNCSDATNNLGWGIQAEYNSGINCEGSTVSGCLRGGVGALSGSSVRAYGVTSQSNSGHGLFSENGGVIVAHSAKTINNSGFGIHLGDSSMGTVVGSGIVNTGNALGTFNNSVIEDVASGQPRVLFYGPGGARIDNANAAAIFFNTAGGAQFEISHRESAVNHLYVKGAATGESVELGATGSDSVIDLALSPKGTGSFIKLGAGFSSSADAPVVGYIQIRDNNGILRKLAIIA